MEKSQKFCSILFLFVFCSIFAFFLFVLMCVYDLPKNALNVPLMANSNISILSNTNNPILVDKNKKMFVPLSELNDYTKNAFIAVEDSEFFQHTGFNFKRIISATLKNVVSLKPQEGASTISQQLIKNLYLTNEKTLKRKIQEAFLTQKLEKFHTKNEILECYLNSIYFGSGVYGIENASCFYFGKSAKNLKISESATLAAIIKSPALYNPLNNPENCLKRRNLVLQKMHEQGFLDNKTFQNELTKPLFTQNTSNTNNHAFISQTLNEAKTILDSQNLSNYQILTYYDEALETNLKHVLEKKLNNLKKQKLDFNVVVMDNTNGGIISLISSTSFTPKRQPASLIKPILCYAPAFENGILSPASPILDSETNFSGWTPKNVDDKFDGFMSCRQAIINSKNIPAIKTLEYVGLSTAKTYGESMNLNFDEEDNHLALALGALKNGVTPLEIAACYSCFANEGKFLGYHFVKQITDKNNNVILNTPISKKVFSPETAFLMCDVLYDCAQKGTAKKLGGLPFKLAAKTGTVGTKDKTNTDAWCCAFNKNFTVCVWIGNLTGNAKFNLKQKQNGGNLSALICKNVFEVLKTKQNLWFEKPKNVEKVKFDLNMFETKHKLVLANSNALDRFTFCDFVNTKFKLKTNKTVFEKAEQKKENNLSSFQKIIKNWLVKLQ